MMTLKPMICCLILMLACVAAAADDVVFSGPQPGEQLSPLKVIPAYGEKKDPVDLVAESDGKPTLLVFVHGANRPAARLTRVLMNYAEMRAEDGLYAATIWLDNDRSAAEQYLRQAVSWWGVGPPVGISVDGAEGPGSYGLNRNVNITVLVASGNRVAANYALVQPSETDATGILTGVVKLIEGDVPAAAEEVFLSLPTRKPQDAPWNTAPRDVRLRRLICDVLSAADETEAEQAALRVEEYTEARPRLQEELSRVADSLTRGRTDVGSLPATPVLRRWRERLNGRQRN
jgi:hypothetical protein